jgi:hypothetical protein
VGRVNNVLTVVKEGGFTAYNTDTEYVDWFSFKYSSKISFKKATYVYSYI